MILSDTLKKQNILLKVKSSDRWSLIEEMIDVAVKNKDISDTEKEQILGSLIDREKSMSTGIGNGVAIPHCITPAVTEIVVMLALSQKGIDFDSIDNLPVKISVLLIVPKNKLTQHIKTLANIARLMNNDELRDGILAAKTPDSVIKEISRFELK
jgi:PTS system fructose-specific IIA component